MASAAEWWTTCSGAPVARQARSARSIASASAACGRESRKVRYCRGSAPDSRVSAAASGPGTSAWTSSGTPASPRICIAGTISVSPTGGNSLTPLSTRNALKPSTPASISGRRSAPLPGTTPPQKPTSMCTAPRAASRLAANPSVVVVGGTQLSGMSTRVVTPPAAAAAVALANPSHAVRPGSLTWTWVFDQPGHHHRVAGVEHDGAGRHRLRLVDRRDSAVLEVDAGRAQGAVDQHAAADDHCDLVVSSAGAIAVRRHRRQRTPMITCMSS